MTLNQLTRRHILSVSGVALVGLAGCLSGGFGPDRRRSTSPTASEREYAQRVDTPESITVRQPEGKFAVRSPAHSPEEDMFESAATWDYEDWLVTSPKDRELLNFSQGTDQVAEVREFIAATDLTETTLLVHQYNISTCETRQLTRLKWDSEFSCGDQQCVGISLHYELTERDSDCQGTDSDDSDNPPYDEGSHANETTFIRIPAQIQSYGRFSVQV